MSRKYEAIKAYLKEEVLKPESKTRMPTILELMRRFRASQSPVSRAVHDLEQEGVLYCRRGVGIVSRSDRSSVTIRPKDGTKVLGNIAFFSVDYFAGSIWEMEHTLNVYASQLGYVMKNHRLQRDSDRAALIREAMKTRELRGVVWMSSTDPLEAEVLELFGELPCPVVILDSYFSYDSLPDNVSVLIPDAWRNGAEYARFFHARGHRKIGFIRSAPDGTIPQQMIAGLMETAAGLDMELTVFSNAIKSWESNRDAGRNITENAVGTIREKEITGLIYIGTGSAIAGRRILWRNNIRAPEDVSIFSHGDDPLLEDCIPAISAAKTDFVTMSRDALDLIAGSLERRPERRYPATLVERESVINRN